MSALDRIRGLRDRPRLIAVALALFLFAPVLLFSRVHYDDHWLWGDDSPLRHPTAATFHDVFFELDARARHDFGTEYLPVRDVVVAADMAIWGDNEHGPHAVQLALYVVTVLGLGSLLVRFGFQKSTSWLAAMLWAAHPLHVESVAWLSERKGVLAGLFFVACGHAWVRYRDRASSVWLVLAVLASVAAVWSKAPAMFGVALLAAWDLLLLRADRRRWIVIAAVGLATVLAAIPVVLVAIDGRIVSESVVEVSRVVAPFGALGHYIESLLLLRAPSISYPIGTDGPGALELALGAAAMLASLWAALRWWRDPAKRPLLALLAWAWIWFLPISHLIAPVHIFVADRFAYLWLFAGCGFVAYAVQMLPARWRTATTALLICVLGIATIRAQSAWTSSVELFSRAFATNPRDPSACENLAIALTDDARAEEALVVLDRGLRARPGNAYLLARKARVLDLLHRRDEALATSSAAASTQLASAMWTHAVLLRAAGRANEALAWAALAARRHPEIESYVETYAQLLIETNRPVQARAFLLTVVMLDPSSSMARRMLGMR